MCTPSMSVWTRKTSGAYMTKLTSHQPPESELELSEPEISTEQPTHWQPIDPVGSQVLPSPFVCHQPCSLYTSLLDSIGSVASNIDTCQTCFLDFNFWLQTEHEVVKGYDEKYNMEEEDSFENKDKEQEEERQKMESERSRQPFNTSHFIICYTTVDMNWSFTFRHVTHHVPRHWNHHWQLHCDDPHRDHRAQGELLSNVSFTIDKTWKLWRQRSNLFFFLVELLSLFCFVLH